MSLLINLMSQIWHLYLDVAIFMLFGFFVAAMLYLFFKADHIKKHLGRGKIRPVLLSALFGIPIPL